MSDSSLSSPVEPSGQGILESHSYNVTLKAPHDTTVDIEHMPVEDDPRQWSEFRKNTILLLVSSGSMIAGLSANIQNPAIQDMEIDLLATASQISLSVSLFILVQGSMPLMWSAISEVEGRRLVYLISLGISVIGSIVVATSKTIGLVIGFRCLQAAGSSAVMSLGAATLADVFDPKERGAKLGVYYMAPLMGPSLGPIFGGVLTSAFNWRAVFWFLVITAGSSFMAFLCFFKDTYRRERSMICQSVLRRRLREYALKATAPSEERDVTSKNVDSKSQRLDPEKQTAKTAKDVLPEIKVTLKDVNPLKPVWKVLKRINNVLILISSGFLFAYAFVVVYTGSRTLGSAYHYSPLKIGFVLLSFGIGSIAGSVLGGRFSDYELARLKAKTDGKSCPEMRLRSTVHGLWLFPPFVLAFGWVSNQRLHIAVLCVFLLMTGMLSIWVYSSTLAYIVDANVGRSSTAVAVNSCFRGTFAFIITELAVPMQDNLGDGWMYTIIAGVMVLGSFLTLLVMKKGEAWRQVAEDKEPAGKLSSAGTSTLVG